MKQIDFKKFAEELRLKNTLTAEQVAKDILDWNNNLPPKGIYPEEVKYFHVVYCKLVALREMMRKNNPLFPEPERPKTFEFKGADKEDLEEYVIYQVEKLNLEWESIGGEKIMEFKRHLNIFLENLEETGKSATEILKNKDLKDYKSCVTDWTETFGEKL
jgi:hypothetical protein